MTAKAERKPLKQCRISVVLPVYNEVAVLRKLSEQIIEALIPTGAQIEVLFVNDGSEDGSAEVLDELAQADTRVRVLHLSRNFGHQAALQAGLTHASGDAIVVMDSDMQDSPDYRQSRQRRRRGSSGGSQNVLLVPVSRLTLSLLVGV